MKKEVKARKSSKWQEAASFRLQNKTWLGYSNQIARRIIAALEEQGDFNQSRLAEILNVSPQYISKVLQGKENLTLETIAKISDVLGIDLISFPSYKYNRTPMGCDMGFYRPESPVAVSQKIVFKKDYVDNRIFGDKEKNYEPFAKGA